MITLEKEFQTNANQTGLQTFRQIKQGTRRVTNRRTKETRDQNVYIYVRIKTDKVGDKVFGYEVVIPQIKKAGTYPLPGGGTQTYDEDTEMYPGASVFGQFGWFCASEANAERVFDELVKGDDKSNDDVIEIPKGEFTVTEYAEQLGVAYVEVANWVKEQIAEGRVRIVRQERRHKIGRATNILAPA
jgi:hypothetical protein